MEDSTADLILTVQLQDLFDVYESQKSKVDAEGGAVSDLNTALSLSIEELRKSAVSVSDHRLGWTVCEAGYLDDQPQTSLTSATPRFDELCTQLAENAIQNLIAGKETSNGSSDAQIIKSLTDEFDHVETASEGSMESRFAAMHMDKPSPETKNAVGEVSVVAGFAKSIVAALTFFGRKLATFEGKTSVVQPETECDIDPGIEPEEEHGKEFLVNCAACGDGKAEQDVILATCGDQYCQRCTRTLFDLATTDESLYPPRCCREPIPLADVRHFLGEELVTKFERKAVEFNTHDRTYCYDAECSAFILPPNIDGDKATCAECYKVTCKICKSAAHENDCPEDPAREGLMSAAAAAGWQQCYRCKRLVELEVGCNHMTYVQESARQLTGRLTAVDACAMLNFATFVRYLGKNVLVTSGTKIGSSLEQK